jgi:hypothetical protein
MVYVGFLHETLACAAMVEIVLSVSSGLMGKSVHAPSRSFCVKAPLSHLSVSR